MEPTVDYVTRDGVMSDGTVNVIVNLTQKTELLQQLFNAGVSIY